MTNPKILIFIPMYHCEKQISRVIDQIKAVRHDCLFEVLIIDNGSQDNSVGVAIKSLEEINFISTKVIQNDQNISLGGSHKVAFDYTVNHGFDYCMVLHGDDQAHLKDMIQFIHQSDWKNYDCILGSRFHPQSVLTNYGLIRILGNKALNLLISLIVRRWITDMGAGINLYHRDYLAQRSYMSFPNDLTFNVYFLLDSLYRKKRIVFIPITWRESDQVSNAKVFKQGFKILGLLWRYVFDKKNLFMTQNAHCEFSQYTYSKKYSGTPLN